MAVEVTAVVLAGGASTRFSGGDKALATLDGEPLVARVAAAAREATGRPPVVAVRTDDGHRALARRLPDDVAFATDAPGFEGPLAGVVGALGATETPWIFVCGCDMPLLSAAAIRWLVGRASDRWDAVCVVHPDGTPEPMHALYRRVAVERARDGLPRSGGVRALLDALPVVRRLRIGDAPPDAALPDSLSNVNTREELAATRRRLADGERGADRED